MNFTAISKVIPFGLKKGVLLARKHSPAILTGIGLISGGAATVLACRATSKVPAILNEHDSIMELNDELLEKGGTSLDGRVIPYTPSEHKHERIKTTVHTGVEIFRVYSPAIALGALSATCILGAHNILSKRNAAIAAAYSVVQAKFTDYRGRVREELGEDKDRQFLHGLLSTEATVTEIDEETGKKKKVKKTVYYGDTTVASPYAKVFDDASVNWVNNAEMNLNFLRTQERFANQKLVADGYVLLNDVYDSLGIPRTSAGSQVGWVYDPTYGGDGYIDFGIYSLDNQEAVDFINGYTNSIWLDFNVDGVVWDLIDRVGH